MQPTLITSVTLMAWIAAAPVVGMAQERAAASIPEGDLELMRIQAGRRLLAEGVDGLRATLDAASAPPLTFDQETQVRAVHEAHVRALENLLEAQGGSRDAIAGEIRALEEQLLLAALKFLNPAQRTALTGSVGGEEFAELNSDLPEDEEELREYLGDLRSPAARRGGGGGRGPGGIVIDGFGGGRMPNRDEIQEIRINENSFTAEQSDQTRGRTEVITRGGTGRFNGDFTFEFADESLDARNFFAATRPPYQERDFRLNLSGPVIQNRLTLTFSMNRSDSEDGDNLFATTPNGLLQDAIVRPRRNQHYTTRATAQLSEGHVLNTSFSFGTNARENNGVGNLGLPIQGHDSSGDNFNFQVKETAVLSRSLNNEVRFRAAGFQNERRPATVGPHIVVSGFFRGGGSPADEENTRRTYEFGDLLMYTGQSWSLRAGFDGLYHSDRSVSRENFNGTFTFPDLESFLAGRPETYSINTGDPLLEVSQFEYATFLQSDWRVSAGLTLSFGVRYEGQTNLVDRNNVDPRVGFAYSLGGNTVVRGGTGIFHRRLNLFTVQDLVRLDGLRQQRLEISEPGYPNPFLSGAAEVVPPSSVRVGADDLAAPYTWNSEVSIETTFADGLVVTGSYRFVRGVHLFRTRNLNAPLDPESPVARSCRPGAETCTPVRPDPSRGNVYQLESTGTSNSHDLRIGFRRRFSAVNINGSYNLSSDYNDVPGGPFGVPADNYDLDSEWGRFGPRHRFDGSFNLRLPWNINANTQLNWDSGRPYTWRTGFDDNRDTNNNDRPPGVPRNSLTGSGFREVDLELSKSVQLVSERVEADAGPDGPVASEGYYGLRTGVRMTISAEIENLFNNVNFQGFSGVQTSPFFRLPTRARDGRQIELSVRFNF